MLPSLPELKTRYQETTLGEGDLAAAFYSVDHVSLPTLLLIPALALWHEYCGNAFIALLLYMLEQSINCVKTL